MTFDCKEQLAGVATLDFYLLTECDNFPEVLTDVNANEVTYDPEINNVEATIQPDSLEPLYLNYTTNEGATIDDGNASTTINITGKMRQRPVYITA